MSARTPPASFEARYAEAADPWGFAVDPYERAKYAATVDALGERRFAAGLELGCSIGELTALLAPRCARLVALDAAPTAVARARGRVAGSPGVEVLEATIPEGLPRGAWDLVVASEVLYYLGAELLDDALAVLLADLLPGGVLLAVHWTGSAPSHRLSADDVHARLLDDPGLRRVHGARAEGYRLDLLERA